MKTARRLSFGNVLNCCLTQWDENILRLNVGQRSSLKISAFPAKAVDVVLVWSCH